MKSCHICGVKKDVYVELSVKGKTKSICEDCYRSHLATPRQPIEGELLCSKCDAIILIDDMFCNRCGYKLKQTCNSCTKELKADDLFCGSCGDKV